MIERYCSPCNSTTHDSSTSIYDDSVPRPQHLSTVFTDVTFGSSAATMYAIGGVTPPFFYQLSIGASGVTQTSATQNPFGLMVPSSLLYDNTMHKLYSSNRIAYDPVAGTLSTAAPVMPNAQFGSAAAGRQR